MSGFISGLQETQQAAVTRTDERALHFRFPTETVLQKGTPVKFDSNGQIVAAVNGLPIGLISIPLSLKNNQAVSAGHCTVLVFASMELKGITTSVAAGDELKYVGSDATTGYLKFDKAASGDTVVAIAGILSPAGSINAKVAMLTAPYKKG